MVSQQIILWHNNGCLIFLFFFLSIIYFDWVQLLLYENNNKKLTKPFSETCNVIYSLNKSTDTHIYNIFIYIGGEENREIFVAVH